MTRFLGLPLALWGVLCLVVALLFAFVVPHSGAMGARGAAAFLLRWGHALVWLLLALFCFARGAGADDAANPLAAAAGLLYLAFILALVRR